MGLKAKEVESALAHTQALETRKEFLARSVKELEDLVRTGGVLGVVLMMHMRPAPLHVGMPPPAV